MLAAWAFENSWFSVLLFHHKHFFLYLTWESNTPNLRAQKTPCQGAARGASLVKRLTWELAARQAWARGAILLCPRGMSRIGPTTVSKMQ